jgi:hypothetical protein
MVRLGGSDRAPRGVGASRQEGPFAAWGCKGALRMPDPDRDLYEEHAP